VREEHPEGNDEQHRDEDQLAVPLQQCQHEVSSGTGGGKIPCILAPLG
jgi:hypothetical protein